MIRELSRSWLFWLFLLVRLYVFFTQAPGQSDVFYYGEVAEKIAAGKIPYLDFQLEYPPLAIPFFYLPGWIIGRLHLHGQEYYRTAYISIVLLTDLWFFTVLYRLRILKSLERGAVLCLYALWGLLSRAFGLIATTFLSVSFFSSR